MCTFPHRKSLKKIPFLFTKPLPTNVFKMPGLGDHQHFSVERSFTLDPENWVAQIESHKKGIQASMVRR